MKNRIVPASKPRNPLVAATLFRRAGSHDAVVRAERQRAQHALRRELQHLRPHSP